MSAHLKVVTLNESNFRDPVKTLHLIADEIAAGKYGAVGCVGVVLLGKKMEVFGLGQDSEGPSIALLFSAAALRFARELEEHGDDEQARPSAG